MGRCVQLYDDRCKYYLSATTDDKGKADTDKLYLGKYVIKETKAPEGYLLNPKEFEVTLAYKDPVFSLLIRWITSSFTSIKTTS